jgi:hypothetical protein
MRLPEVFVRELSPEEGQRLRLISSRAKHQCRVSGLTSVASATLMRVSSAVVV